MNNAKKVLGLVIAVVMLINVFAVCSFAGAEAAINLILTCDKTAYEPGDTVTFTVSATYDAQVGDIFAGNTTVIGFDNAVIAPMSDSDDIAAHGMAGFVEGYDASMSYVDFTAGGAEVDDANGWNSAIVYAFADDATTATTPNGTVALCQFQMKLASDVANGSYVVGFDKVAYSDDYCVGYVNDVLNWGIYGQSPYYDGFDANYAFTDCTVNVGSADPISFKALQGQPGAEAGTWNVGIVAKVDAATSDEFFGFNDKGTSETIATLGAEVSKNDGAAASNEVPFVYDVDGEYLYRVVVNGISTSSTDKLTVKFYYTTTGSSEKIYGATYEIADLSAAYAEVSARFPK